MRPSLDIRTDMSSFADGVRRYCASVGRPDMSGLILKAAEFSEAAGVCGDSFVKGAASVLDKLRAASGDRDAEYETVRKKSLLRKLLPWLAAAGGTTLALQYGNAWGRHAQAVGDSNGPVTGTLKAIAEAATGQKFRYKGRSNIVRRDNYHSPMTNGEYDNHVRYGTRSDPSAHNYDRLMNG